MSDPFIGEIRMFGGNFAPLNWALCNGAAQSIAQNDALYALIGTTYGGDGINTFNLPDLQGRLPIHQGTLAGGSTYVIGQQLGTETVTLTNAQMPAHSHPISANSNNGSSPNPSGNFVAGTTLAPYAQSVPTDQTLNAQTIGVAGGSQPHTNLMPYLCVTFIISLFGIFPQRN
ncbi:MAG TPA: tail fiber protein [Pyrinomonadaceae bacterium]|nr:tail fiber protein [Pyrinomonadaceae bacterium]